MQIIQKYNYTELKRQEGEGRLYLTPDGESLPSVTTILNKTKDKAFLKKWRARVGEQKAEKIIADSAKIGTALHLYIERFVNGNKYKDLTEIGVQAEKMAQKIIDEIKSKKGCYFSRITGSGSACIGIFSNMKNVINAQKLMKLKYRRYWCAVAKTI